jgi:lysophospholipase L1-like esterase
MPSLSEVSTTQWSALASTKIFFGHQSVGWNILQGIETVLQANPDIGLQVVKSEDPAGVEGGALVHEFIGTNGAPRTKLEAFDSILAGGLGPAGGIAMYKYCFLDITAGTDVEALFQAYRDNMARLRAAHPDIRFVHLTAPLTVNGNPVRNLMKRLLGKPTAADFNAKRNRYNQLLRAEYESKAPLFDLARFESTHADGSREFFLRGQDTIYTLAPELTDDGAHLNAKGREAAAIRFLIFLATAASSSR